MKIVKTFLLSFIGCLILISCNSNEEIVNSLEPNSNPIFPLALGNYWEYRCVNNMHDSVATLKYQITNKIILYDEEWYKLEEMYNGTVSFLCEKQNGIFSKKDDNTDKLICKYPAEEGDEWSDTLFTVDENNAVQSNSMTAYKLVTKKSSVRVPAGEFKCYGYDIKYREYENETVTTIDAMYYPGVGKIYESYHKLYLRDITRFDYYAIELISYKVE